MQTASLESPNRRHRAKVSVDLGFNLFQLDLDDHPVIWSHPDFQQGDQRPSGSGFPILFPFPGRIQGTTLDWHDRSYSLLPASGPQATDAAGNAIHGYVFNRPWRLVSQSPHVVTGEFRASIDQPELLDNWPGDFLIRATYQLDNEELKASYRIENPGRQPLPWGLGLHPYFCVAPPNDPQASCAASVQVPASREWLLNEMLTTGEATETAEARQLRDGTVLGDSSWDHVMSVESSATGSVESSITRPEFGDRIVLLASEEFAHCVVYRPPHQEAYCIEPYTCVPDPWRLSRKGIDGGLRVTEPGDCVSLTVVVRRVAG